MCIEDTKDKKLEEVNGAEEKLKTNRIVGIEYNMNPTTVLTEINTVQAAFNILGALQLTAFLWPQQAQVQGIHISILFTTLHFIAETFVLEI